jgi:hypothetical protein
MIERRVLYVTVRVHGFFEVGECVPKTVSTTRRTTLITKVCADANTCYIAASERYNYYCYRYVNYYYQLLATGRDVSRDVTPGVTIGEMRRAGPSMKSFSSRTSEVS